MKTTILAFSALLLSSSLAFAAGSSGTGNGNTPTATPAPKNSPLALRCKKGEVVKTVKSKKTCVKIHGSLVPDDDLYHQGYVLAKAGEYDWAIEVLSSVKNQNNPDVLNMLGYSNRKAGRTDLGISFYAKALELRPDFTLAREYLGEGYVAAGKIDLAKAQLEEIKKICGTTCEEYKDLSEAIDKSHI
jgi:tetratricopeptide (TPR) repeat protein